MNTINKNKEELLKKLKQRLEDSWSGFAQVIEEAEEFIEDVKEAEDKEQIDYAEVEDLNIFYDNYIDNLKYQAEVLQDETQQAIDKFEGTYNISYMKDEG
tara:strand:- start:280 stop:579 length:300 start_codon:yes stop_codon:yes gene_type:complete